MSKFKASLPGSSGFLRSKSVGAWTREFKNWLEISDSPHTQRAYRIAWAAFRKHNDLHPMDIRTMHILDWLRVMQENATNPATISARLAAISSFYNYALRAGLCRYNPVDPVPRPQYIPYNAVQALEEDQVGALLNAIPRSTRQGKRDLALIYISVYSGHPISEICQLRFGDFQPRGKQVWITWPRSDSPEPTDPVYWKLISNFLSDNGQLGSIRADDHIFTALSERAAHLPNVTVATWDSGQPLTASMVNRLIKKYAKKAGLDSNYISAKTLRYSVVNLKNQFLGNPQILTDYMNFRDPYTAEQILRQLKTNGSPPWKDVGSILDG